MLATIGLALGKRIVNQAGSVDKNQNRNKISLNK